MRLRIFFQSQERADPNSSSGSLSTDVRKYSRDDRSKTTARSRSGFKRPIHRRRSERGFTVVGLCLALIVVVAGIGLGRIIWTTRNITRIQVNMDQCTGRMAIDLRAAIQTMENSYSRMEAYRIGTIATCIIAIPACPEALAIFNNLAKIERGIQIVAQTYWREHEVVWRTILPAECGLPLLETRRGKFPPFDFKLISGDVADLAKLNSSSFTVKQHAPFSLALHYRNFNSTAAVEKSTGQWKVRWSE